MKAVKPHALIIWAVGLVVVLALAFVIPFVHNEVFWIALGCTVAMFGVFAFVYTRSFLPDRSLESKLLGWPIFRVGYTALILQVIVGFALMARAPLLSVLVTTLVEVLVFASTVVSLTVKDAAREVVRASEATVVSNTETWRAIRARAAAIAAASNHPDLKKLAEEIRFADPTPTSLDDQVEQMLETLSSYADADNIRKAFALLEQRKALAKESKR